MKEPVAIIRTFLLGTIFAYWLSWLLDQLHFPWELFAEGIWW
jgi:hypothetical protein